MLSKKSWQDGREAIVAKYIMDRKQIDKDPDRSESWKKQLKKISMKNEDNELMAYEQKMDTTINEVKYGLKKTIKKYAPTVEEQALRSMLFNDYLKKIELKLAGKVKPSNLLEDLKRIQDPLERDVMLEVLDLTVKSLNVPEMVDTMKQNEWSRVMFNVETMREEILAARPEEYTAALENLADVEGVEEEITYWRGTITSPLTEMMRKSEMARLG